MKKLIDTASCMGGIGVGTPAAGVIISDAPITEYLPLHRPTGQNEDLPIKSVAQYDMDGINDLGLLKVDFLGLVTLTLMAKACELIEMRHGRKLNLENIPTDDPEVYRYISEGHTVGMFQLEGNGMTSRIMQMQPTELEHLIAMIALFRPGPRTAFGIYRPDAWGNRSNTRMANPSWKKLTGTRSIRAGYAGGHRAGWLLTRGFGQGCVPRFERKGDCPPRPVH